MNHPHTEPASPADPHAQPRVEMFGPIHKALRLASGEVLVALGSASPSDLDVLARVVADLAALLSAYEAHLDHEERFVRPAAAARLNAPGTAFDDHPQHARQIHELRALADGLLRAPAEHRAAAKRALYLQTSTFIGESFVHMAEEEQVLEPLLERVFSQNELREIHGNVQAALTNEERAYSARYLFRALSREERLAMVDAFRARAPEVAVLAMLDSLAPFVDAAALKEMLAHARGVR